MAKGAGDTEEKERAAPGTPADAKKMKRSAATDDGASSPGAGLCDDVIVGNILARLPARAAVASMALSKHHRRLIRSTEFRGLHCRLAPPLPRPHIAYLATAPIKRRPEQEPPGSWFLGFHVAGAGASGSSTTTTAPMRSLAGRRYVYMNYVNTCNGVVLLASEDTYSAPCSCVLWNPAVADVVEEVTVPDPNKPARDYLVLGLGYGQRSKTYKLLLCCQKVTQRQGTGYSLATFALGGDGKEPTELPAAGRHERINQEDSLYMDGKIYLLNKGNAAILAFDVDEERVASIDVPVKDNTMKEIRPYGVSKLMEMYGRPCLASYHNGDCAVWVLSGDHQWDRRFLIRELQGLDQRIYLSIKAVWDCGGVLVLYLDDELGHDYHDLLLYNVTEQIFKAKMHRDDTAPSRYSEFSNYALCWGYRPTHMSPSSILGKLNRDDDERSRECSRGIMKALKPIVEQDRRKGQKATLVTVSFMDFLVRMMQKLPDELQQVLEMKMIDSDDPDFSFQNVPFADQDL